MVQHKKKPRGTLKMNEQQFKTYLESQDLWRREEEQKRNEKDYLNDLVSNMVKTEETLMNLDAGLQG